MLTCPLSNVLIMIVFIFIMLIYKLQISSNCNMVFWSQRLTDSPPILLTFFSGKWEMVLLLEGFEFHVGCELCASAIVFLVIESCQG